VTGHHLWKKTSSIHLISEICTVSDEAFALLVLENNWGKWMSNGQESPKYTSNAAGNKMFEGWSEDGIWCCNCLHEFVTEN
jgi:hypothetical protein